MYIFFNETTHYLHEDRNQKIPQDQTAKTKSKQKRTNKQSFTPELINMIRAGPEWRINVQLRIIAVI